MYIHTAPIENNNNNTTTHAHLLCMSLSILSLNIYRNALYCMEFDQHPEATVTLHRTHHFNYILSTHIYMSIYMVYIKGINWMRQTNRQKNSFVIHICILCVYTIHVCMVYIHIS